MKGRDMVLLAAALLALAAPSQRGPAGSPAAAVSAAYLDVLKIKAEERPFYRWLWLSSAEKHRADFLAALDFHVNLLSTTGKTYPAALVCPDVVRLDVRDYGWDKRLGVWEQLAKVDVFFHVRAKLLADATIRTYWPGGVDPGTGKEFAQDVYREKKKAGDLIDRPAPWLPAKEIDLLRALTYSEAPVLMAEWFFVQSARQVSIRNKQEGAGYYDFLGIKKRQDVFDLAGADEKKAGLLFREWRAVVDRSGISQQNRQVVALGAVSGRLWFTLDTFTQQGKGNAKRNLRRGEFAHDAEEHIFSLPNGLPGDALFNKDGEAQESAPDKIGPDDSALRVGRDGRVHAHISCWRCHGVNKDFLQPVDDWARKTFRSTGVLRLADKDRKVILELESQYLRDLTELLDDDRALFSRAVRRATAGVAHPGGLTIPQAAKIYCTAWNRYVEEQLTLDDAAREIGTTGEALLAGIKRHERLRGGTDLILASFIDEPAQKISRLEWEDSVAFAASIAAGVRPPEIVKEEKVKK